MREGACTIAFARLASLRGRGAVLKAEADVYWVANFGFGIVRQAQVLSGMAE